MLSVHKTARGSRQEGLLLLLYLLKNSLIIYFCALHSCHPTEVPQDPVSASLSRIAAIQQQLFFLPWDF